MRHVPRIVVREDREIASTSDDQHFFAGRDGVKVFDFDELEHGMATGGYTWAGNWAEKILRETAKIPFSERG